MSDVKNIITMGIGANPAEIGYFVLDGLSSWIASSGVSGITVLDGAGWSADCNARHLITRGIGANPGRIGYFILGGLSPLAIGSVSGLSIQDSAVGAASVLDAL